MFRLSVPLYDRDLKPLKDFIRDELPTVKSSHRCEALARGLGFKTYASAKSALNDRASISAEADYAAFNGYLEEKGFQPNLSSLVRAMARLALQKVHDNHRELTIYRIGVGRPTLKGDGTRESWSDCKRRFASDRNALLRPSATDAFLTSLALVSRISRTKTIRRTSSYKLKHIAENMHTTYPDGQQLGPVYVPNGILIAAAIHAGFDYRTWDEDGTIGPNASFNMSERAIRDLDAEIRPNGAEAQSRERLAQWRARKMQYGRNAQVW